MFAFAPAAVKLRTRNGFDRCRKKLKHFFTEVFKDIFLYWDFKVYFCLKSFKFKEFQKNNFGTDNTWSISADSGWWLYSLRRREGVK